MNTQPILYNILLQFSYPKVKNPYLLISTHTSDPNLNIGESIAIRDIKVGFLDKSEPGVYEISNKVFDFNVRVVEIKKAILFKASLNINIIVKPENEEDKVKDYLLAWDNLDPNKFIEYIQKIAKEIGID